MGTFSSAGKPMPSLRMSENWTEPAWGTSTGEASSIPGERHPREGDTRGRGAGPSRVMEPGKVMPSSWTIMPRNAIMEMRPCLISTARRRARPSVSSNMKPPGVIGPGSTPMSPLTTTLEAACWPGATKATAGAARRARASLAILMMSADGVGVRADRVFLRLSSGCEGAGRGAESLKALFGSERSHGPRRGCRGANAHARGSLRARVAAMSQLAAAEIC